MKFFLLFLAMLFAASGTRAAQSVTLGQASAPLDGPWAFHTGDDPKFADSTFDDSKWEHVDLTPPPGAHDSDVGLSGYVPGWEARGHKNYGGYAWYRLRVSVNAPRGTPLMLAGPALVDTAYEIYFNGKLIGSDGDFIRAPPVSYSIQPREFALPASSGVIAIRTWMSADDAAGAADAGGIHIAPIIGSASGVHARYQAQWLQTFWGYVVDAVEPIGFTLLGVMALSLMIFAPRDRFYPWLALALLLLGAARFNQVVFFWMQIESENQFVLLRAALLDPLVLGSWIMAWRACFALTWPRYLTAAIWAPVAIYMIAELASLPLFGHAQSAVLADAIMAARLASLLVLVFVTVRGARNDWLALPGLLLIAIGLWAGELSQIHVPGIWFPFGVGVSRTQYAYAAAMPALFILLLAHLNGFARNIAAREPV